MKVILAAPFYDQPRGNKVTVERMAMGLANRGIETKIISSTEKDTPREPISGDLFHGFHATHFYHYWKTVGERHVPYILTLTGTDFNHDLFDRDKREMVIDSLNEAKAIHVFSQKAKEKLLRELAYLTPKTFVIPQGVSTLTLKERLIEKEPDTFLYILPAGIRKVKNVPFAITMLAELRKKHNQIRLWIVGPIIEEEEGRFVKDLVTTHGDWVKYLGTFPHEKMGAIYGQGDVILNTSISEGQSSALLESMSIGVPVLVSNNEGNQSVVVQGETGLIYNTDQEFLRLAEELLTNHNLRNSLASKGRKYIEKEHSWDNETTSLINIYNSVLNEGK